LKILFLILLVESYKYFKLNNCWDFCYKNNIIYSYSDFIRIDYLSLRRGLMFFIISLFFFYFILLLNILIFFSFILLPIKVTRGGMLFNVFIYYPNLLSFLFKKYIMEEKNVVILTKTLFINYLTFLIWCFPRFIINYAFISTKIFISYKKNPEKFNIREFTIFLNYLYKATYDKTIISMEIVLS
jgi:hypothetical protein